MNKKLALVILSLIFNLLSYAEKKNPMDKYISDEVFQEAEKKFNENKNFFIDRGGEVKVETGKVVTNNLGQIFKKVETIIRKDRKWGCVVFYVEKVDETRVFNKRKVVLGNTILEVEGKKYYLKPYETGIEIRNIVSGEIINLKISEGR